MGIIISEVRIKNFRSLKDLKVKLSPNITLLVGMNNAGKTTFLRALNIALNTDRHFIGKEDLFINKNGEELPPDDRIILIDIKIIPSDGKSTFEEWANDFGVDISSDVSGTEFFAYRTKIDFSENRYFSQLNRYKIVDWESGNADEFENLKADISNIPFYFIDAQRDLNEETTKRTSDFGILAGKVKYDDAIKAELEDQLKILNDKAVADSPVLKKLHESLDRLNRTVQNSGGGVEITPFPKKVRDLSKGMKVHFQDGESDSFSLEYHGMGTRSWASLLTFKAKIEQFEDEHKEENKPFHPSLGLEEPEAHLHPNAQRQVYKQLKDIKGQKIISTHSPYIVQQADLSEIRHFSKKTDETIVGEVVSIYDIKLRTLIGDLNLTPDSNKNRISSLEKEIKGVNDTKREFIRKYRSRAGKILGDILFSRCVILCEGETEEQALQLWGMKYFGQPLSNHGIDILGVDGFTNYIPYVSILSSFDINWFIFSDGEDVTIDSLIEDILLLDNKFHSLANIFALPSKQNFEEYIYENYPIEVKKAKAKYELENWKDKPEYVEIETSKIQSENDEEVLKFMKNHKTKFVPYYVDEISKIDNIKKVIPPLILELFDSISVEYSHIEPRYIKLDLLLNILENIKDNANT